MTQCNLTIVSLSEAFQDLWEQLGADLKAGVRVLDPDAGSSGGGCSAAVILAAGGAERQALDWLKANHRPTGAPLYVVGVDPDRRLAIQLIASGAADYFAVPEDGEILRNSLAHAVELARQRALVEAHASREGESSAFHAIVGDSPALKEVLGRAERVLPHAEATLLIVGETGTGKELLAKALHEGSPRRSAPFVAINCSAIPENLMESELFGHERGAFTSAHAAKPGLFEVADGGTLFLDEIGTLPLDLQAKLLRVLEGYEVRRVGGLKSRKVDLRILAATNEDLSAAVAAGRFRKDLFYRLGVIKLELPPLRERERDILLIARSLVKDLAKHHGLPVPSLDGDIETILMGHHWPGNVRELRNAIERALLLSNPGTLDPREIREHITDRPPAAHGPLPFPAPLDRITEAAATATLRLCNGNRSETARRLQISRQRLRRLLGNDQDPADTLLATTNWRGNHVEGETNHSAAGDAGAGVRHRAAADIG